MAKEVKLSWNIPLTEQDKGREMTMSVSVNDPQHITSALKKADGKRVAGVIHREPLGTGSFLKGKSIKCDSLVTDFDKNSNETEVTFEINQYSITYNESVERDGDAIIYAVKIQFV